MDLQEDLLSLVADRDNVKTAFALHKAIAYGVDPRFSVPKQVIPRFVDDIDCMTITASDHSLSIYLSFHALFDLSLGNVCDGSSSRKGTYS